MVRMVKPCLIPMREIQSLNLQSKTYLASELNAMNFPVSWEVPLEMNWPWDPWDATTQKDNSPKSTKRYTYTYIPSYFLSQRFSTHIFPQQNGRFSQQNWSGSGAEKNAPPGASILACAADLQALRRWTIWGVWGFHQWMVSRWMDLDGISWNIPL